MMKRLIRGSILLVALACLTVVPTASAQYRPPQQEQVRVLGDPQADLPVEKPWKPWLIAVLCTVAVAAVAFKKPGRTHLD